MNKHIIVGFAIGCVVTVTLYVVGYLFDVEWLQLIYSQSTNNPNSLLSNSGGSALPLVAGVVVGFLTSKIIKNAS